MIEPHSECTLPHYSSAHVEGLQADRDNLNAQLQEVIEARDRRTAMLTKIHGFVTSGLGGREPSLYEMRILEMIQIGLT